MNYADIKCCDVANGPGVRVSLFVSGCTHYCKGCFNEAAWDFAYGNEFTAETQAKLLSNLAPNYIKGLSVLGGEPFELQNQIGLLPLLKKIKSEYKNKDIWCYTGYLFDKEILLNMCQEHEETKELLSCIDVLVDGRFIEEQKNINLRFRGSSNQRIIMVQKSLETDTIVLWNENS